MSTQPQAAVTATPGSTILWFHAGYFLLLAAIGYFARDLLFGAATALHSASVAVVWLSTALVLLALFMAKSARSGSAAQAKLALIVALVFDFQAPIAMGRYPGSIDHFEVDLGLPPLLFPALMLVLVGVTAFELSRVWRIASQQSA